MQFVLLQIVLFFIENLAGHRFHSQKHRQSQDDKTLGNPFPPLPQPKFDFYSSFWAKCWVGGEVGWQRSEYLYLTSRGNEVRIAGILLSRRRICLIEKCTTFTLNFPLACQFFFQRFENIFCNLRICAEVVLRGVGVEVSLYACLYKFLL